MNKIGVVEAKSEWDISSEELLIRVSLGNNQEINLIFPHNVVDDTFFNHSCKDREEAKKKVIKTLQTMDNLLNCLTQESKFNKNTFRLDQHSQYLHSSNEDRMIFNNSYILSSL